MSLADTDGLADASNQPLGQANQIETLLAIMKALRDPESGCPWDIEQTFSSIMPYTIEEAYEVADAVERNDMDDLCDELGDLLLQVVFHARMAEELGAFRFDDVVAAVTRKMIRRHPHVFGDLDRDDAAAVKQRWEAIKAEERAERARKRAERGQAAPMAEGALGSVPGTLPPVQRALKLQQRAARVGFDWPDAASVLSKLREETAEVEAELSATKLDPDRVEDEIGDVLFVVVNLARKAGIDPNSALARTNTKFLERFRAVEETLGETQTPVGKADLETMEAAWQAAKGIR